MSRRVLVEVRSVASVTVSEEVSVVSWLFCRGSSVAVPRSVELITVNGKT